MHSDDDHEKNTHLCETGYTLQISRPDGSVQSPADIYGGDDAWGRPISFRIDGFSHDGNRVFLFISEGYRQDAQIDAVEYDMRSGTSKDVFFKQPRHLDPVCAATLHILGTSPTGLMVIATSARAGCTREEKWQLNPQNENGRTLPEFPVRLPAGTAVTALDPGIRSQLDKSELQTPAP
jgi:hypothetical protein